MIEQVLFEFDLMLCMKCTTQQHYTSVQGSLTLSWMQPSASTAAQMELHKSPHTPWHQFILLVSVSLCCFSKGAFTPKLFDSFY